MGRKSKHAGSGHLPLTNYERKEIGKDYGTNTARLGSASQMAFGHCSLSLHPATEQPVATPSGFIYDRPAILEYLLHQTQELKKAQLSYEQWIKDGTLHQRAHEERKRKEQVEHFEDLQKVVTKKRKGNEKEEKEDHANPLARSSFWLADFQPERATNEFLSFTDDNNNNNTHKKGREPPPSRPLSPMSQTPLRRKDLIPLDLKRNSDGQVICAISEKSIVTQPAVALRTRRSSNSTSHGNNGGEEPPAQVVLEQVFKDLGDAKFCPVTGRKISKILKLQAGGSSFAASGRVVEAQTHRPGMT
jgi:nitric oxide synthase-interacting protein